MSRLLAAAAAWVVLLGLGAAAIWAEATDRPIRTAQHGPVCPAP